MTDEMIIFDLTTPMETRDNYFVKLKGLVKVSSEVDKSGMISSIEKACTSYLKAITLMEALDLVDHEKSKELVEMIDNYSEVISKLEVSTVDAVEKSGEAMVEVDIDPSLESQTQKKGLFSRVKRFFTR